MSALLIGALLRIAQALLQATPTILIGLLVAGVFRRLLGYENTRKLFGDNTWRSLPQAWAIGMLLPVCSLGVIPVLREMRKAGVSGGTILAFGLTAPLFNPISVLYGLTLSDPVVIFTFSLCSLAIITVVGVAWDWLYPQTAVREAAPPAVPSGWKRMLSIGVFTARELVGPTAGYIGIGLLGVAGVSLILPKGCLQTSAEHNDLMAPLLMTLIAIPVYATPMTAMVQLASMFQHGNSVGAAFALLALGAGANLGLAAWMVHKYGWRRTLVWFSILIAVVIGLAYGVDKPLYPHGVEPAGHTHAFDDYCAPFSTDTNYPAAEAWRILREKSAPHEIASLAAFAALAAVGLFLRAFGLGDRIERWLELPAASRPRFDVVLPGPALGMISLVLLIGASVLGCFVYYPAPQEILKEMRIVNAEVVVAANSGHWETALHHLPEYDAWTRKLEVSMCLRSRPLTPYRRMKAQILREKLELLKHEVEEQDEAAAQSLAMSVANSYLRLQRAYALP